MARMISEQKLQFYPTHPEEATKALLMLSDALLDRPFIQSKYGFTVPYSTDNIEAYELLKSRKLTQTQILNCFNSRARFVAADLFAGEGEWIGTVKRIFGANALTIANEIEEGRANKCKRSKYIDIAIHGPVEDLNLPKNCIDLMTFNPPYMVVNNESLEVKYFNLMLERNYLSERGVMIIVLPKDGLMAIKDNLITNFVIKGVFKMHKQEFDQWGQYVVIAQKRTSPLNQRYQERDKEFALERFIELLEEASEAKTNVCDSVYLPTTYFSKIELEEYLSSFEEESLLVDTTSAIWRQAVLETQVDIGNTSTITMPMSPKVGELCQIIASGYINGEMTDLETGETHIVAGGVREVEATTTTREDFVETTTSIRKSVPFLNVLLSTPNGYVVKELCESSQSIADAELAADID